MANQQYKIMMDARGTLAERLKGAIEYHLILTLRAWWDKLVIGLPSAGGGRSPYPATDTFANAHTGSIQTKFRQFADRFGDSSDGDETDPDDFDM
jgi:hypothetical protein